MRGNDCDSLLRYLPWIIVISIWENTPPSLCNYLTANQSDELIGVHKKFGSVGFTDFDSLHKRIKNLSQDYIGKQKHSPPAQYAYSH